MDSNVLAALISGICSVVSALGAVFLKEYLGRRRATTIQPSEQVPPVAPPTVARRPPVAPSTGIPSKIWKRPVLIVIGCWIFGMATRSLRPFLLIGNVHYEMLIAWVVLVIFVLVIAVYHRRQGFQIGFQLENLAIWSGFASGWSLIHGGIWSDFLAVTIPWWLGSAIIGGFIVLVRRRKNA